MFSKHSVMVIFFCVGISSSQAFATNRSYMAETLFSKTTVDGVKIELKRQQCAEMHTTQNGLTLGSASNAFEIKGRTISNDYKLIILKGDSEENVLEARNSYTEGFELHEGLGAVSSNLVQEVIRWNHVNKGQLKGVLDVEVVAGEVIVLFSSKGSFVCQVIVKDASGKWATASSVLVKKAARVGMSGAIARHQDKVEIILTNVDGSSEKYIPVDSASGREWLPSKDVEGHGQRESGVDLKTRK